VGVKKLTTAALRERMARGETLAEIMQEHPILIDMGLEVVWVGTSGKVRDDGTKLRKPFRQYGVRYLCCDNTAVLNSTALSSRLSRGSKMCRRCSRKNNSHAAGKRRKQESLVLNQHVWAMSLMPVTKNADPNWCPK